MIQQSGTRENSLFVGYTKVIGVYNIEVTNLVCN